MMWARTYIRIHTHARVHQGSNKVENEQKGPEGIRGQNAGSFPSAAPFNDAGDFPCATRGCCRRGQRFNASRLEWLNEFYAPYIVEWLAARFSDIRDANDNYDALARRSLRCSTVYINQSAM